MDRHAFKGGAKRLPSPPAFEMVEDGDMKQVFNDVSVIILDYKTPDLADRCKKAVFETTRLTAEILDNSVANNNIHSIWNDVLEDARTKYVCFLTADTQPMGENWLYDLMRVAEYGNFAVVGPSTNACYNEQSNRFPDLIANAYGPEGFPCFLPNILLAGFCMLVEVAAARQIGGFREDFDFYGGDLDFQVRLGAIARHSAWVIPAFVFHEWGASAKAKGEAWYTEKRQRGDDQFKTAVAEYAAGGMGIWFWDRKLGKVVHTPMEAPEVEMAPQTLGDA
jgi:hypothetical protein